MQSISIQSVAAAHEVASTIEGGEPVRLVDREIGAGVEIRSDRDFTEIAFSGDFESTARVMIERPSWEGGHFRRSAVTWSSSNSRTAGRGDAVATARLLAFAAQVAATLDEWAESGQLPRLSGEVA